jgi:hypothetical protein
VSKIISHPNQERPPQRRSKHRERRGPVTPNPSIERTPYGTLRVPPVAAHVERYASALEASCFASRLVREPVRGVGIVHRVAVLRVGRAAWLQPFLASGASRRAGRAIGACAARALEGEHRAGAERPAMRSATLVPVKTSGRTPRQCLFGPGSHNPSIERTVSGVLRTPPTAAHVER